MKKKKCFSCGSTNTGEYENLIGFPVDYCKDCGCADGGWGFEEVEV